MTLSRIDRAQLICVLLALYVFAASVRSALPFMSLVAEAILLATYVLTLHYIPTYKFALLIIPLTSNVLLRQVYLDASLAFDLNMLRFYVFYTSFAFCIIWYASKNKRTIKNSGGSIVAYGLAIASTFNIIRYFGVFGAPLIVHAHGSGALVTRSFFHMTILRMDGVLGVSPGGHSIIYALAAIFIYERKRKSALDWMMIAPLAVSLFYLASLSGYILLVIYFVGKTWKTHKSLAILVFAFAAVFGAGVLFYQFSNQLTIQQYIIYIISKFFKELPNYYLLGGNYDMPTSSVDARAIRDLGILSSVYTFGLFGAAVTFSFIYLLATGLRSSLLEFTFLALPTILIFVHGDFFSYPIISICLLLVFGVNIGRWPLIWRLVVR